MSSVLKSRAVSVVAASADVATHANGRDVRPPVAMLEEPVNMHIAATNKRARCHTLDIYN